jgi:hypothetical protein
MKRPPEPSPQADGSSDPLSKTEIPDLPPVEPHSDTEPDPEEEHLGATEDQVSDTSPPAGEAYKDEPKQG